MTKLSIRFFLIFIICSVAIFSNWDNVFAEQYRMKFEEAGITYFYTLIDDAIARVIRSEGGFIWACKNYDGDVMSDMISTAFGSLAMMTSVLVSPDGNFEYEAAHGTVTRHYYRYLKGEETSTNPVATIFAWTGALAKRGELDQNSALSGFAKDMEKIIISMFEEGICTKDLAGLYEGVNPQSVSTIAFIQEIRKRITKQYSGV
jgi:isocitrate dehydrogenase